MTEFLRNTPDFTARSRSSPGAGGFADCFISFGGNVGDVRATFDAALALISLHCDIRLGRRSGIYSTAPMGSQSGSPFLNSICQLSTLLSPCELLRVLQSVENQLGRVRDMQWGPRTLDLDLLNYGNQIVNEPNLVVPHPSLTYRRFVLDPLAEIDRDWLHPSFSESVSQIIARLDRRPLNVLLVDATAAQREKLASQLVPRFPQLRFVSETENADGNLAIRTTSTSCSIEGVIVDLSHSPGCMLEKMTSACTAIFDQPRRISDW